jgi:hypothetical protein
VAQHWPSRDCGHRSWLRLPQGARTQTRAASALRFASTARLEWRFDAFAAAAPWASRKSGQSHRHLLRSAPACVHELRLSPNGSTKTTRQRGLVWPGAHRMSGHSTVTWRWFACSSLRYARALPLLRGGSSGRRRWREARGGGPRTTAQMTSPCCAAVSWPTSGLNTVGKSCACFAARGRWRTGGPGDAPAIP